MEKKEFSEDIDTDTKQKDIINNTNETIHDIFGDKKYAISFKTINEMMDSGEPFTLQEVIDKIISRGGIARVSIGITIKEYLRELIKLGRLKINPNTEKYEITEIFLAEDFSKVA